MQVCTSLQTDNHASTPPLGFLQAGCPSCRPTNSVKALKDNTNQRNRNQNTEDFSLSRPWPRAYFLNGPNAAASIAPTLIRHWFYIDYFPFLANSVTPIISQSL